MVPARPIPIDGARRGAQILPETRERGKLASNPEAIWGMSGLIVQSPDHLGNAGLFDLAASDGTGSTAER